MHLKKLYANCFRVFLLILVVTLISNSIPAFAGNMITVKRGHPLPAPVINWNVVGGSLTCSGTTNYPITAPTSDFVKSYWETGAPHNSLGSKQWDAVYAPAGLYTFTCTDAPISDTATLIVDPCLATETWNGTDCVPAPSSPSIGTFTNNGPVTYNTPATLSWSGVTNATACSIDNGIGAVPVAGPSVNTSNLTAVTTYTLTCTGPGAPASRSTTVTIASPVIPGGLAPAGGNGTAGFYVLPSTVAQGGVSQLFWSSTGATSCSLTADSGADPVTGGATSNAVGLTTGPRTVDTKFTLTCTNGVSPDTTAAATLTVTPAPSASFNAAPTCPIADGFPSCTASISWTSANIIGNKVSLYDSTLTGYYGTFGTGVRSSSVTIPYGGGTYEIRDGDHVDAAVKLASTSGTAGCNTGSAFTAGKCKKQYTITVNQTANGTIAPSTNSYFSGDTPTFSIVPTSGYHIVQVTIDGSINKGSIISYIFLPLTANHTITATYAVGPPPSGTLSAPLTCTIPTGSGTCASVLFNWNTINPIGLSQVVADGSTGHDSTPANSGPQSLTVNYGGETYRLYNNSLELANVTVAATCGVGGYDTISNRCVDPLPSSGNPIGGNNLGPGTITVTCTNAAKYAVYKSSAPNVVVATTTYPAIPPVIPINISDTYWYVCIQGSYSAPSSPAIFNAPPPTTTIVSLDVSPRTISKDGLSTLSWNILYPWPTCTFTAKSVCANDVCSQSQRLSEQSLNSKIASENTDANDIYSIAGPRSIVNAFQNVAPNHASTDQKAYGKKTFKIAHTTDFTINCGGVGHMETKRVQVTQSNEQ